MTRVGKKEERRNQSPRRPKVGGIKTGSKKDNLPKGYKEHANCATANCATANCATEGMFISKVKGV